jgi:hypothetical protein
MVKHNFLAGAGLAGSLLLAIAALDLSWGSGNAGLVHAIVGLFGVLMLAVSMTGYAGKGRAWTISRP